MASVASCGIGGIGQGTSSCGRASEVDSAGVQVMPLAKQLTQKST